MCRRAKSGCVRENGARQGAPGLDERDPSPRRPTAEVASCSDEPTGVLWRGRRPRMRRREPEDDFPTHQMVVVPEQGGMRG